MDIHFAILCLVSLSNQMFNIFNATSIVNNILNVSSSQRKRYQMPKREYLKPDRRIKVDLSYYFWNTFVLSKFTCEYLFQPMYTTYVLGTFEERNPQFYKCNGDAGNSMV